MIDWLFSSKKGNKANPPKEGKQQEGKTGYLSQFGVVNEVRSVSMDEGTQSQAVLPTEPQEEEENVWGSQRIRCGDLNKR